MRAPTADPVSASNPSAASTRYAALQAELAAFLPPERIVTDPLRRHAYGGDASFYRLLPQIVVVIDSEIEMQQLLAACRRHRAALTFRAAGTSLSGQAISDSVLVLLGDAWRGARVAPDGTTITLGPAVIGAQANRLLAPFGRKIGPDPASIDAAMIGGIAANNASGMCCGVRHNSYHTPAALRVMLTDGSVLDTAEPASVAAFRANKPELLLGLATLARQTQRNAPLAARIRHKYRMKNTTGYGLNALVDFDDPIDILTHLMIGSEGTLGFMAQITYRTVPDHAYKATALVLFETLAAACAAVSALAAQAIEQVDAVELMDRAALASVEEKPGMPAVLATLPARAAALLIETRADSAAQLAMQIAQLEALLAGCATVEPAQFSTDPVQCALLWKVRKGTFPAVGARRATGSTVIIEDVAFPVAQLAAATQDLQRLLHEHGYTEAIIFGHALEGNLHFVFTQDFGTAAEVARYSRFMQAVADLVVGRYDGALKAEHGTGRNMAPFVAQEWGPDGLQLMREIKQLFDPDGLLNPGVILSDDAAAHVQHLKPLPAADPLVDRCIECGFCEPQCPSAALTFTPRQRIAATRELARLAAAGDAVAPFAASYAYNALDTCAGCGQCALVCPVGIDTGKLVKQTRGASLGPTAQRVGQWVADRYGAATAATRTGLAAADLTHRVLGTRTLGALGAGLRTLSGERVPPWTPHLPRPARQRLAPTRRAADAEPLVYFPSCAARTMGAARGDDADDLPVVTTRVLRRAGFAPHLPALLDGLCCGQPFESKGLLDVADRKSAELVRALVEASHGGRDAIVFDTSPCAWRLKQYLLAHPPAHEPAEPPQGRIPERAARRSFGELRVLDITEALHTLVLPRLSLTPQPGTVAVHPVCSVRKQGLAHTLLAVARACSEQVVMPDAVGCCGWAGDKGWTTPELNAHALRDLRASLPTGCASGVSTSRTCEIGLSQHGGVPYRSIVHLVDAASTGTHRG